MLQNTLFIEDAEEDLEHFLKGDKRKRVLIFPPVNNYRRFLIHQLVQERYNELLQTFSIGQGFARRTVVCYKTDFIGTPKVNGELSQSNEFYGRSSGTMGIESQCTPTASPEHNKSRQIKSSPAYQIYRPPAARQSRLEKSPASSSQNEQPTADPAAKPNRQKRPDRAVYVPRHRRGAPEVETSNVPVKDAQSKLPKESPNSNSKVRRSRTTNDAQTTTSHSTIEKVEDQILEVQMPTETTNETNVQNELTKDTNLPVDEIKPQNIQEPSVAVETTMDIDSPIKNIEEDVKPQGEEEKKEISDVPACLETTIDIDSPIKNIEEDVKPQGEEEKKEISDVPACLEESDKRDRRKSIEIDEETSDENTSGVEQLKKSSPRNLESDTNRRNEKVIKQPLVSKVLIISSAEDKREKPKPAPLPTPVLTMTPPEKKLKKIERPKSKPAAPPAPSVKINRDECDWESLFDDNGDCLDPTLIDELTESVGEVVIEKPKSNYKPYTRTVEVSNDEFGHVVEIYNFPAEFKSSDLAAVFSPFKSKGFELKWVDDNHCLGVFSSPIVAAEVLSSDHPFVKTRPLSEATPLSKSKVRKSSEFLQPYRTRPETCAALARRLVTKSLGVKLATARQEREQEKIVLREAKEKRRLANKQREEVWEGIISDKSSS